MNLNIIDVNSIIYSAQHVGSLSADRNRGCPVGGIKLLTRKLSYLLANHAHVVCAFDSRTSRRVIMPEYKSNRKRVPEVILQNELVIDFLSKAGVTCIKMNDMEADDIIFNLVEKYRPVSYEINIHSGDMDLAHNIIDARTRILAVNDRSFNVSYDNFSEVLSDVDVRVPLNLITAKKIFMGDKSDTIDQFVSTNGRNGKTLFKQFLELVASNDAYDPNMNRLREFFEILIGAMDFTDSDLELLSKRCDIFYPRQAEIIETPCNIDDIDLNFYKTMVKSLKDIDSCRTLVYTGPGNDEVDNQLFEYGNRFRSGEFHVDNNLSLESDPFEFESSSLFIRDL